MTVLLDTQLLLWSQVEPHRVPDWLASLLEDPEYLPYFSVISIWEVAIKAKLKRPDFAYEPHAIKSVLIELDWRELPLTSEHALAVYELPLLHGDPFDRALVAQAKIEGLEFVTADRALKGYGSHIRVV